MFLIIRHSPRLLNCIRACNVNSIAYYSRRNPSRNDTDGSYDALTNWQHYGSKEKRFFLPGSLGISWQVQRNIKDICLTEVVDYFNESNKRLHLKAYECPILLRSEVQNLFPGHGEINNGVGIIKLSYKHFDDEEKGQKFAYTASKVICHRLMVQGYWSDFINVYTGKAEYDGLSGMRAQSIARDTEFPLHSYFTHTSCVLIKEKEKCHKHSMVYTDAPVDLIDRFIYDL